MVVEVELLLKKPQPPALMQLCTNLDYFRVPHTEIRLATGLYAAQHKLEPCIAINDQFWQALRSAGFHRRDDVFALMQWITDSPRPGGGRDIAFRAYKGGNGDILSIVYASID
ncbi:MAG: hypothetical protein Q8R13_06240 [bacterium]|nr:hypothetical protein [bacterium]